MTATRVVDIGTTTVGNAPVRTQAACLMSSCRRRGLASCDRSLRPEDGESWFMVMRAERVPRGGVKSPMVESGGSRARVRAWRCGAARSCGC